MYNDWSQFCVIFSFYMMMTTSVVANCIYIPTQTPECYLMLPEHSVVKIEKYYNI